MSEPEKQEAAEVAEVVYVVQRERRATVENNGGSITDKVWEDIATVWVPIRTKRATVIKRALEKANISADGDPPKLRALDAESAEVHEPEPYQPPMQWRLP